MSLTKTCAASRIKAEEATEGAPGGTVTGYASTFDRDPDCYGDVVAKGAFAKTLERWEGLGKPIPLLYGHDTLDPKHNIGRVVKAEEDERGLLVTAEFDPDNDLAQYARKLVAEGRLYQFSFAFDPVDQGPVDLGGAKANEIREVDLYEVSLVQIPANQHATVEGVKRMCDGCKAGRRNSKADEDELKNLRDWAWAVETALTEAMDEDDLADVREKVTRAIEDTRRMKDTINGLIGAEEDGEGQGGGEGESQGESQDEGPEPDASPESEKELEKAKLNVVKSAVALGLETA